MMADSELFDIRSDRRDGPRHFVAENGWHRNDIVRGEQQVGMAQPGRAHIDQHFASNRSCDLKVLQIEPVPQRVNDHCLHAGACSFP